MEFLELLTDILYYPFATFKDFDLKNLDELSSKRESLFKIFQLCYNLIRFGI